MAVRESLLCLLVAQQNYAFRLHHELVSRIPARAQLNVGQTYSTLERLQKAGLVAQTGTNDEGLPVYRATEAGRRAAHDWLQGADSTGADAAAETAERLLLTASIPDWDDLGLPSRANIHESERRRWLVRVERDHPANSGGISLWNDLERRRAAAVIDWIDDLIQPDRNTLETLERNISSAVRKRGRPSKPQS